LNEKWHEFTNISQVFATFELTVFLACPLVARVQPYFGTRLVYATGVATTAVAAVAFGLIGNYVGADLTEAEESVTTTAAAIFIAACIAARVVEGLGNACFKTASFSVIVAVFPGGVATVFAVLEAFVGLGFITGYYYAYFQNNMLFYDKGCPEIFIFKNHFITKSESSATGPIIGTTLAQWKGYAAPFVVLGGLILLTAFISIFVLHSSDGQKSVKFNLLSSFFHLISYNREVNCT
jgi:MFS family permease